MIVTAIIAFFVAITIIQYQNYVARNQVIEALALTSTLKTAIAEYRRTTVVWPLDNMAAGASVNITDKLVTSVVTKGAGLITVTMRSVHPVNSNIQEKTLQLQAADKTESIVWSCDGAPADTAIDDKYLPVSCR